MKVLIYIIFLACMFGCSGRAAEKEVLVYNPDYMPEMVTDSHKDDIKKLAADLLDAHIGNKALVLYGFSLPRALDSRVIIKMPVFETENKAFHIYYGIDHSSWKSNDDTHGWGDLKKHISVEEKVRVNGTDVKFTLGEKLSRDRAERILILIDASKVEYKKEDIDERHRLTISDDITYIGESHDSPRADEFPRDCLAVRVGMGHRFKTYFIALRDDSVYVYHVMFEVASGAGAYALIWLDR